MRVRLLDDKGNLLPEDVCGVIDVSFSFDREFEVIPSAFPTFSPTEYEIKTEAKYCNIEARVGRIVLFSYSGEVKDLDIIISSEKIEAIRKLKV
jgi:hypothetical protein